MRLALITDAWHPQVNGVVTTLMELVKELEKLNHSVKIIHPNLFSTRPCPGYPGIDLAIRPKKEMSQILKTLSPDAIHIATEGPLGWAARSLCLQSGWPFTSAFHTKFPEIFNASVKVPVSWGYALLRRFHQPSALARASSREICRAFKTASSRSFDMIPPPLLPITSNGPSTG